MSIYYVAGLPFSDELYHYGILGQKWGVRRFQNKDGTLTEEGRARYRTSAQQERFAKDFKQAYISNYDVKTRNNRMRKFINKPQMKDSLLRLQNAVDNHDRKIRDMQNTGLELYDNVKLYEKYLSKACRQFIEDEGLWDVYPSGDIPKNDWLRYEDWSQGKYDPQTIFLKTNPNHPLARKIKNAEKNVQISYNELYKIAKQCAKDYLGEYGNEKIPNLNTAKKYIFTGNGGTLESSLAMYLVVNAPGTNKSHK